MAAPTPPAPAPETQKTLHTRAPLAKIIFEKESIIKAPSNLKTNIASDTLFASRITVPAKDPADPIW